MKGRAFFASFKLFRPIDSLFIHFCLSVSLSSLCSIISMSVCVYFLSVDLLCFLFKSVIVCSLQIGFLYTILQSNRALNLCFIFSLRITFQSFFLCIFSIHCYICLFICLLSLGPFDQSVPLSVLIQSKCFIISSSFIVVLVNPNDRLGIPSRFKIE